MLVALVSEPGVASLGGGAFLTIAPARRPPPITVDGTVEMPGRGLPREAFGRGMRHVVLAYGGGTEMSVGHGSVATPGALLAFEQAHRRFGAAALAAGGRARRRSSPATGFPLGQAASGYLEYRARARCSAGTRSRRMPRSTRAAGCSPAARRCVIPELADFLDAVAAEGAAVLHRGDVAAAIAADMAANGGLVTAADLAGFEPVVRPALPVRGRALAAGDQPAAGDRRPGAGRDADAAGGPARRRLDRRRHGPPGRVQHALLRTGREPGRRAGPGGGRAGAARRRRWPEASLAAHVAVHGARVRRRPRRHGLRGHASSGYGSGVSVARHRRLAEQLPRRARAEPGRPARAAAGRAAGVEHGADGRPAATTARCSRSAARAPTGSPPRVLQVLLPVLAGDRAAGRDRPCRGCTCG